MRTLSILLPIVLMMGCASSVGIRPIYTTQSTGLIKGDIALRIIPYDGLKGGDPASLGATKLEGRIDDYFNKALQDELAAFGFAIKADARLELSMTVRKAESTWTKQGPEGVFTTAIEARFTVRDRLQDNAIVYDRVHSGEASHSQRYGGHPASASLVDALATTYGRFLSDPAFYDKLVGEYGFSKSSKPAMAASGGGPVKGDALELEGSSLTAFPILAKYYDDHPVGKAAIRNRLAIPATNLRVSLFVPSYMDAPKECAVIAELRDKAELGLYALFNDKIMAITEGAKAAATMTVDYAVGGLRYTQDFPLTIRILNRNALVWDDDRKAAAFVTAKDPAILTFAKNTTGMLSGLATGDISRDLLKAAILHEALAAYGMSYETDPYSPYAGSKGGSTLDFLQFPRQTLEYRAGDCDDLSILYCALLESVGVETAFITIPGHIYMAFAVEASPERGMPRWNYADDFIVRDGKTWIPVETTLAKEDFLQAWQAGKEEWAKGCAAGNAALYPTHEAWKTYEAVDFSESAPPIVQPERKEVLARFVRTLDRFIDRELYPSVKRLKGEMEKAKDSAEPGNRLAVLYARFGKYDLALAELESITSAREYVPALINAGNVHYLRGDFLKAKDFYARAYRQEPENPNAVLQLSRALYELKDYGSSDAMYGRLKRIDTRLASSYGYLESGGKAKAEAANESPAWQE
jgi:tetratricopeptide (TPR) repeat protein